MSISVRRARQGDIPALLALLVQVNMVHHDGRPDLFNGPTTKYSAEELAALLEDAESPVFVCVDEGDRVLGHGFCVLQHSGGRLLVGHDTLYIDDICVDEAARGRGVGRALYSHILDYARQRGCYNVTLNVWSCNPGARAFYEKLGMTPYRVGMEQILDAPAVREATAADLDALLELYLHLHETNVPEDREALRQVWAQIEADPGHHILVAEQDGRIVSSCALVIVPNLTRGLRPYALIENVVTRADCRRRGLASACLARAVGLARSAGCYKVMLLTGAKDEATLRFYRRAGFDSGDKTAFILRLE